MALIDRETLRQVRTLLREIAKLRGAA
jgi:hypothetical protein